ncbi:hypothetical protein [Streptomyces phytophilus]|uniref:hypothetical protein n=1 Tax=Streptomyces phytophilus TaxID=722715 RepID=UPI0015F092B8|nr:hypothetical protein [Streptomyces phytophilus]
MEETISALVEAYDDVMVRGQFSLWFEDTADSGYAVQATPRMWALPLDVPFDIFAGAIQQMVIMYPDATAIGGVSCGAHLHIEPVQFVSDRERAVELARLRRIPAIYDITTDTKITI